MAKKQGKENRKRMVVTMSRVATADAEERICRAIAILLRAAARGTTKSEDSPDVDKEKPSGRSTYETTGDGECKDAEKRDI